MKKRIIITAVSVVLIAAAILFYFLWQKSVCVGTIAGEKVTEAEYTVFLRAQASIFLYENDIYETTEKEEFWKKDIDGKSTRDIVKERTADKLKELKIQLKKAKESGVKLDKDELASAKDYVQTLLDGSSESKGSKEREGEFVKKFGVSSADYERVYKEVVLIRKMISQEIEGIVSSEEEMAAYYEENKDYIDDFTIRDILFATVDLESGEELSEEEKIESGNKAVLVLQKIQDGEDIEKLALENSDDSNVKSNKGQYTFKVNKDSQDEIERWTLNSMLGDMGIVQTLHGYHVLKLEKRSEYEEVKQYVGELLAEEKYLKSLELQRNDPVNEFKIKDSEFIDSIDFSF